MQLVVEILSGEIDAALATSPVSDPRLSVEEIWRNRLLICLHADHELASDIALRPENPHGNLTILIEAANSVLAQRYR